MLDVARLFVISLFPHYFGTMKKISQNELDISSLLSELMGVSLPTGKSRSEPEGEETYQLPVKHTRSGTIINEENPPSLIGHFYPGRYLNKTHPHGHNGIDLKAPPGSPVYPIGPGKVVKVISDWKEKYKIHSIDDYLQRITKMRVPTAGNQVNIEHEDGKVLSRYLHLDSVEVGLGQEVDKNTVIAIIGQTGNAMMTGRNQAHLHHEVMVDGKLVNPQSIVGKKVGSLSKKANIIKNVIEKLSYLNESEAEYRMKELEDIIRMFKI